MRKGFVLVVLVCSMVLPAWSQATIRQTDPLKLYKEAEEHYNFGRFALAYPLLQEFLRDYAANNAGLSDPEYADALYMLAVSAKEAGAPEAEKALNDFAANYKGHPRTNGAYFHLGEIAYRKPEYKDALAQFDKVDEKALSGREARDFAFERAFSHFALKNFQQARGYFNAIAADTKSPYQEEAMYYAGLSSYYLNDYNGALKHFQKLETSKKYAKTVPYYIASIKFVNKDYKGVIDYAEPKLKQNVNYSNEIAHLLGVSYYELKDYEKAKYYLEQYVQNAAKVTPEDYYILGYVQAQQGDCQKAIQNLKNLSPLENALGQNAMFLLGQCYQKTGDKQNARNAFLQASRKSFDKNIQEEATFQYAKLSYELEYTNDALLTLKKFITDYPKSKFFNEANEILADIFLNTRNYEEAMQIIEALPNKSPKLQEAYQKMAYYRGIAYVADNKFAAADDMFNRSLKYPNNKSIEALCYYWKADMAHQQGDYPKSIQLVGKFLPLSTQVSPEHSVKANAGTANYLQGYNYYKQKKFPDAVTFFNSAVTALKTEKSENVKQTLLPDAMLRLADGYFMQKQYAQSAKWYDEVIKANYAGADYALYQKAIIDGLGGRYTDKIAGMKALVSRFPNSAFADDALIQAGNTYMALGKDDDAVETFKTLLTKNPKSDQVPDAYLKLGLIAFNRDRYEEALGWYKKVVQQYPKTPAANEAMMAIKDIYVEMGDPNAYVAFANQYPGMKVNATAQDSLVFLAAEGQYQKGNTDKALQGFNDYLLQFPGGYFALQAHYYRGECLFSKREYSNALADYQYVLQQGQSRYTERSTSRAANIYFYDLKDNQQAYQMYKKLEAIASQEESKREFPIGLMRTTYQLKKYSECVEYVGKVSALTNLPDLYKSEMSFYKGMSQYFLNDYDNALKELAYVIKNANNEQAAQAKYTVAKIHFLKKNYKQSEKECMEYTDLFPAYEYYLGKTYLLLADIYLSANNMLQAKATLQSLLDNYTTQDDVRTEGEQKLAQIQAKELEDSNLKIDSNSPEMQFDNTK